MWKPVFVVALASAVVGIGKADSFTVGVSQSGQLVHVEKVSLKALPYKVRVETVTYTGHQAIKSIVATDLDNSKAKVHILAGGIGATYVTMQLESEKGEKLRFEIQIYG